MSQLNLTQINIVITLPGAKSILGEPIKDVGLDIGEPNHADKVNAYFEVKVSNENKKVRNRYNLFLLGSWPERNGYTLHLGG